MENLGQNVFSLLPYFVTSYLFHQLLKYNIVYNALWQGKISLICQFSLVGSMGCLSNNECGFRLTGLGHLKKARAVCFVAYSKYCMRFMLWGGGGGVTPIYWDTGCAIF